jgi:drug/metabolite transporter (DMT)-like permease
MRRGVGGGSGPKVQPEILLVLVALIWGATFVLVKRALEDVSTLLFLAIRFTLAAVCLALMLGSKARATEDWRRDLGGGVLAGMCLFTGYVLQTLGLKYTTPSKAGFLTGMYIPLVPVMGAMVYRKMPRRMEAAGIVAAAAGMTLMTLPGGEAGINRGDMLVAGCAAAYAMHILVLGHFTPRGNVSFLAVTQIATAAVLSLAVCGWAEPVRWRPGAAVWIAVGVTGILATAVAFAVQTWAQRYTSATRTALIFALEPVFAWLTSFAVAGELLTRRATLGAGMILAGILAVEWKHDAAWSEERLHDPAGLH